MIVPINDKVCIGCIKILPQELHLGIVAMLQTGTE
jgi:predicted  nucleic acid-binding Zn-ribbon protein